MTVEEKLSMAEIGNDVFADLSAREKLACDILAKIEWRVWQIRGLLKKSVKFFNMKERN